MNTHKLAKDFEAWAKDHPVNLEPGDFHEYASYEAEIAWDAYQAAHNAQQAIIDRLMLEFCPDEMTAEQVKTWEDSQRRVEGSCIAAPHWWDTPQDSLGGKTAREGYLANPTYAEITKEFK